MADQLFCGGGGVSALQGGMDLCGGIAKFLQRRLGKGQIAALGRGCRSHRAAGKIQLHAAAECGRLLWDYNCTELILNNEHFATDDLIRLSKDILQAARVRMYKTEYISCPGCGRTLFNLEQTIAEVKAATAHLQGLKIGIMGCIVNGPGEMADADYGYVGAGRGKVSLYKGKECVLKNIPQEQAVEQLLELIKKESV